MKHQSIRLETPCEFINITPVNPLISKCQIKVCYVGDAPNRNRSIITKDVAREMANSLPGSPIVGYYNESNGDFEEHNRIIDISNGKFEMKDTTKPYGFVDLGAKVWFQKFLDDGVNEHEYLMTEGYLWTGQYPECQRIIEQGNNQSMELHEQTLDGTWTKDNNGKPQFFIINEAIISKLCVLGEDCEPCFEGSSITKFSFDDNFKNQLFSMMNELKELLKEGGAKEVFNRYAVEIGDSLWSALWNYISSTYPDSTNGYCSKYHIDGVFEDNGQKFAILQDRADMKYYRFNFSLNDSEGFVPGEGLVEVTKTYTPSQEPQFALEAVQEFETEYKKKQDEEDKKPSDDNKSGDDKGDNSDDSKKDDGSDNSDDSSKKDGQKSENDNSDSSKDDEDKKKKKKEYSLDEIEEYVALKHDYEELQNKFSLLEQENQTLTEANNSLTEFKNKVDRKEKEAMINSFYMLSDTDKEDVITNIDKYSVDDIEAKLSIICVRNKVNFNLDDDNDKGPTTYNLSNLDDDNDAGMPAWVKAAIETANKN